MLEHNLDKIGLSLNAYNNDVLPTLPLPTTTNFFRTKSISEVMANRSKSSIRFFDKSARKRNSSHQLKGIGRKDSNLKMMEKKQER